MDTEWAGSWLETPPLIDNPSRNDHQQQQEQTYRYTHPYRGLPRSARTHTATTTPSTPSNGSCHKDSIQRGKNAE